ncbi:hypothetical protein ATANTOWER_010767, partial [Ataeniobius toweri]|nr:hypothetical protein [Ataeniobius toweri]
RGNVRHKPASHHQFYREGSQKPQRPLTRMIVSQRSQSQKIPLTSSQLCPVLLLLLQKDPVIFQGQKRMVLFNHVLKSSPEVCMKHGRGHLTALGTKTTLGLNIQ